MMTELKLDLGEELDFSRMKNALRGSEYYIVSETSGTYRSLSVERGGFNFLFVLKKGKTKICVSTNRIRPYIELDLEYQDIMKKYRDYR